MTYLYPIIASFFVSLLLTKTTIFLAKKINVLDVPTQRKIHNKPIPLLGGVAVFLSFFFVSLAYWLLGYITDLKISNIEVAAIWAGGLVIIIGGALDDKYNLSPAKQIIFPIIAALIAVFSGIGIHYVTNPLGGIINIMAFAAPVLGFLWLLGMMYTTKFLDGLDGLVSGITTIGAIIIFIVSLYWDVPQSGTSVLSLILAGSCLGFLVFNWHPAKIFLGEGGSIFCGFMLGILAIISGSKIATALLIMGIPILDVLWVIVRRFISHKSIIRADKIHIHFRFLSVGFSQRQTTLLLYGITILFGVTSLLLNTKGKIAALIGLLLFMAGLAYILTESKNDKAKN